MKNLAIAAAALLLSTSPALAQQAAPAPAPAPAPQEMLVEIYRIAPGKHEEFIRFINLFDEANRMVGLPPRQLYVHSNGEGFDFMLIQPADTPDDKEAALEAAYRKLGTPSGANFFVAIRQYIADHSDNFVSGPTTAADWLKGLD